MFVKYFSLLAVCPVEVHRQLFEAGGREARVRVALSDDRRLLHSDGDERRLRQRSVQQSRQRHRTQHIYVIIVGAAFTASVAILFGRRYV